MIAALYFRSEIVPPRMPASWLCPIGEPAEIFENGFDQCLPAGVLTARGGGKQREQIGDLFGGFLPIQRWSRDQPRFQLILGRPQRLFTGDNVCKQPTKVRRLAGARQRVDRIDE